MLCLGSPLVSPVMVPLHPGFPSRLAGCPTSASCGSLPVLRPLVPLVVSLVVAEIAVCATYLRPDTSILIVRYSLRSHPGDRRVWFPQLDNP